MKKIILFTFLINISLSSCIMDYNNTDMVFINKTKKKISVLVSNHAIPKPSFNKMEYYVSDYNIILPDSIKINSIPGKDDAWRTEIKEGTKGKLFFYAFDVDSLNKYKSSTMIQLIINNKFIIEKSLTEKQLDENNWKIVFE